MIGYRTAHEMAKQWKISYEKVCDCCEQGLIDGVFFYGRSWFIPEHTKVSDLSRKYALSEILRRQKNVRSLIGVYRYTLLNFTYNSNRIENNRLTYDQIDEIFKGRNFTTSDGTVYQNDIIETVNHFQAFDFVLDCADSPLTEELIKTFHLILMRGSRLTRENWFTLGGYKKVANRVGGKKTCPPEDVKKMMETIVYRYNRLSKITVEDIVEFHVKFERIHPFDDGNGRVGRLIMFKECLKNNIVPFIIEDELKAFYYRGIREWDNEKGYLIDTCLTEQDRYKSVLWDRFKIKY